MSSFFWICFFFYTQLPFTPHGKWLFLTLLLGFMSDTPDLYWPHLSYRASDEAFSSDLEASESVKVKTFPHNGSIVLLHIGQGDVKRIWCSNTKCALCGIYNESLCSWSCLQQKQQKLLLDFSHYNGSCEKLFTQGHNRLTYSTTFVAPGSN